MKNETFIISLHPTPRGVGNVFVPSKNATYWVLPLPTGNDSILRRIVLIIRKLRL
jgi:hypothetical protein